ncbi:uncharacterized protein LOC101450525, partial [Ceratitis capitata]|uniref:uncharacterized protein LOC101450525 n=1 Tax=Ceratitis capitata TaxID=7213 RepID=UPI0006188B61
KFTNLQCTAFDEGFVIFDFCRLRAVKRDVNELSIKLKFLQATDSMRNVTLRVQLMQKVSGYRPFLYDITTDLCEYLEKRNHPFLNIIFDEFSNHSLAAQKCPFSNELTVTQLPFPSHMLKVLPLPKNEYAIFATLSVVGEKRAGVKVYFMLTD